jgi:hypothetical protein
MKLSLCGALGQRKQSFMLGGSCVPMTLRQMVPLMSPAEGRALCSS